MIVDTVREFAAERVAGLAEEMDEKAELPEELLAEIAEMGLLAIPVDEDAGGAGFDFVSFFSSQSELAGAYAGLAAHVHTQTLCALALAGKDEDRLGAVIGGEMRAALAWAESSEALPMQPALTASSEGEGFRLDGAKVAVLQGGCAALFVVVASLDGEPALFAVDAKSDGVSVKAASNRTGLRGVDSAAVELKGVQLPATALLRRDADAKNCLSQARGRRRGGLGRHRRRCRPRRP